MAKKKVADLSVDVLAESGVRRFTQWDHGLDSGKEHVRHEETTAFVYENGRASYWAVSSVRRELRSRLERVCSGRTALFRTSKGENHENYCE